MKASKILTLIAVYFLDQSQGDGSFKIQSVGYQSIENESLPTFCFLKVSKSESEGSYHFFEGSSGHYDGKICYINGTLNPEGGDLCYTPGIVKSVIRKSVPQDICSLSITEGYEMLDRYLEGTAEHNPHCFLSSTSMYLNDVAIIFRGSSGVVQNDICWVKGSQSGWDQCYWQGNVGTYGTANKKACYLTTEFAHVLGTGFVRVNKTVDVITD